MVTFALDKRQESLIVVEYIKPILICVVLCVQGVEKQTMDDLPLVICRSNFQQGCSAQLNTTGFICWGKIQLRGKRRLAQTFCSHLDGCDKDDRNMWYLPLP